MKAFIDFFSSVKLAIFLLIIITLASILGTLIPQHRSPAEYAAKYGQMSTILIRLQFTRLYQSGWYVTLLFLFTFNTLVCTLTRFSPKLKKAVNPRVQADRKNLTNLKIHDNFKQKGKFPEIKQNFIQTLSQKHYKIREKKGEDQIYLHARKKVLGFFGSDFVHLGIIIILIGGILSGVAGIRFNLSISEGETLPIPGADFQIRLDEFTTDYYPNGNVKDWRSSLTVIENKKNILNQTIEVNHPLSYKGYVFYQSTYGFNWSNPILLMKVSKQGQDAFQDTLRIRIDETVKLSDGKTEFKVLSFIPDFVIGENNQIASRSNLPYNPAVFVEGYQEEKNIFSGWIFAKFPDFPQIHSNQEMPFLIQLSDFQGIEYAGLQIAKDPGVNFIWVGSALLMLGLMIAFYWPPKEIKIILAQSKDGAEVTAGGLTSKNRESFKHEFQQIISSLRRLK